MDDDCKRLICDCSLVENHCYSLLDNRLRFLRDFAKAKEDGLLTDEEFRAIKWKLFDLSLAGE